VLREPVAIVGGDRFIIRSTLETLGGGEIVEAYAQRLRRLRPTVIQSLEARQAGTAEEAVLALLEAKQPLELPALLAQSQLSEDETRTLVESLVKQGKAIAIGQGRQSLLLTMSGWENLAKRVKSLLQDYHQKFPTRSGMPKVELGSRLKLGDYASAVMAKLISQGVIVEEGAVVSLPGYRVRLTPAQQAKIDAFLQSLTQHPYSPPSELIPEPDLLNLLIGQRRVVKVSDSVVFAASAYDEMVAKVTAYVRAHGKVSLAEVRDLFQTSRRYAQAFLEHLDGEKITRRVGDERVLY